MAEQATLLKKLPPVAEKTLPKDPSGSEVKAEASGTTELQAETEVSITPIQMVTYGSFILSFVFAGFAAIIIYRKALTKTHQSFSGSAKLLAGMLALVCLHGFAATYVYTNYLNQERDVAPLSFTVLVWIIFGATIGYLGNRLIEKNAKLDTFDAVVDALTYACVFIFATFAVSDQVGTNIALSLALLAVIAYIIPLSRFLISCKRVKFRRQLSDLHGRRLSLYSQVILPVAIPTIALLFTLELLGPDITLLSMNIVTSTTVLAASAAILVNMKRASEEDDKEASATTPAQENEVTASPAIDPLVTELLAEEAKLEKENAEADAEPPHESVPTIEPVAATQKAPKKPTRPNAPKKPTKPGTAGATPFAPPQKPIAHRDGNKPAPNAPTSVRAPSKPKKRI